MRDTPYMVFEYMLYGDLAELLRKTDPSIRGSEPAVPLRKVNIKLPVSTGWLCRLIYYVNTLLQYTAILKVGKNDNFQMNNYDINLMFAENKNFRYVLELPPNETHSLSLRAKIGNYYKPM